MSKYQIETYYTCTFKITHKLDKIDEKELSNLDKRNDGKVEVIDVRLNNRGKTEMEVERMRLQED